MWEQELGSRPTPDDAKACAHTHKLSRYSSAQDKGYKLQTLCNKIPLCFAQSISIDFSQLFVQPCYNTIYHFLSLCCIYGGPACESNPYARDFWSPKDTGTHIPQMVLLTVLGTGGPLLFPKSWTGSMSICEPLPCRTTHSV